MKKKTMFGPIFFLLQIFLYFISFATSIIFLVTGKTDLAIYFLIVTLVMKDPEKEN